MQSRTDTLTVLQFIFTCLAILMLWGGSALVILMTVSGGMYSDPDQALPSILSAAGLIASGLLLLPSAFFSYLRMTGHPAPAWRSRIPKSLPLLLVLLYPLVILAGYWITQQGRLAWLLLPALHVLAVGMPVMLLAYLAVRRLPLGSPQRAWGTFGSGLALAPALIMGLEVAAMLAAGTVYLLYLASQRPHLIEQLGNLSNRMLTDPNAAGIEHQLQDGMQIFAPYLAEPATIFAILAFTGLIVPLIEEALKPAGVWLLAGRRLSAAGGFAAGALSGAGFALFESMSVSSLGGEWTFNVLARIGTGVVHILTTAMVGWALAVAWNSGGKEHHAAKEQPGRYLRLGIVYLAAVSFHGMWNCLAILSALSGLPEAAPVMNRTSLLPLLGTIAPFALGLMTFAAFAVLLIANRALAAINPAGVPRSPLPPGEIAGTIV